jgi:hypothetical protein
MSQKANLLTLKKNLNINIQIFHTKFWNSFFKLSELLNRVFFVKGVLLTNSFIGLDNNIIFFDFFIFYNNSQISFFRNKYIKRQSHTLINFRFSDFLFFFKNYQKNYRYNSYVLKFKVLNSLIVKKDLIFFYQKLKIFVSSMFSRRFNFFVDFLKLTVLFFNNNIDLKVYIKTLGRIFKFLSKRLHTRFLLFLKALFKLFVSYSLKNNTVFNSIKGFKFLIKGRFQAKDRASSKLIQIGSVPSQSFFCNIDFSSTHIYTLYGAFGIKIWMYRK